MITTLLDYLNSTKLHINTIWLWDSSYGPNSTEHLNLVHQPIQSSTFGSKLKFDNANMQPPFKFYSPNKKLYCLTTIIMPQKI